MTKRQRAAVRESCWVALAAALVLGAITAAGFLDVERELHMDEAVYSYEAVHMARSHRFLARHTYYGVVKPPLHLLMVAASYLVFPISKLTLWLPNIIISVLGTVLLYHLVNTLAGGMAAVLGVALLSLTWTWQFYAISAFTDMGLAVSTLGASLAIVRSLPLWAGIAAALAIGFKQHGICTGGLVLAFYAVDSWRSRSRKHRWASLRTAAKGMAWGLLPIAIWTLLNGNWRFVWFREVGTATHLSFTAAIRRFPFWYKSVGQYLECGPMLLGFGLGCLIAGAPKHRHSVLWLLAFCAAYIGLLTLSSSMEVGRYVLLIVPILLALAVAGGGWLLTGAIQGMGLHRYQPSTVIVLIACLAFLKIRHLPTDGFQSPEWIKHGLESTLRVIAARPRAEIVLIPEDLGYEYAAEAIKRVQPKEDLYIAVFQDIADMMDKQAALGRHGPFTVLISRHSPPSWKSFQRWKLAAQPDLTLIHSRRENGVLYDGIYLARRLKRGI